jgi:hypothetical protein
MNALFSGIATGDKKESDSSSDSDSDDEKKKKKKKKDKKSKKRSKEEAKEETIIEEPLVYTKEPEGNLMDLLDFNDHPTPNTTISTEIITS